MKKCQPLLRSQHYQTCTHIKPKIQSKQLNKLIAYSVLLNEFIKNSQPSDIALNEFCLSTARALGLPLRGDSHVD